MGTGLSYRQKMPTADHTSVLFPVLKRLLLLPSLRSNLHVIRIYQVVDTRAENKCRWQSIITRRMMRRRSIHSSLTLAAEPSEPKRRRSCTTAGLACQERGVKGASRPDLGPCSGKAQPRLVHTAPSGRRGLLAWSLPSNVLQKKESSALC